MSTTAIILLVILFIILFGGFRDWGGGPFYGTGHWGGGGIGIVLLLVAILIFTGRL